MAGMSIRLNRFFGRRSISSHAAGSGYSVMTTVAPMAVVIGNILLMRWALDYSETTTYNNRELFQVTVLYIFMFSLIAQSPFNAVLSKYVSDEIFKEQFDNIRAAFNVGLLLNIVLDCAMAIPFTLHEYYVGQVDIVYILASIMCFVALSLAFYTIMFLSLCKDYGKISVFYIVGMAAAFLLSLYFAWYLGIEVTLSMLLALGVGFLIIASLAYALIRQYFKKNSRHYLTIIKYMFRFWKLIGANLFYTLGLFVHNFVFWTSSLRNVVANSFVCAESYDFATCIGMFTNLSSTVIFVSLIEMNFNVRYKQYSEAIIGGRLIDIKKSKSRMMRMMSELLMSLVRIQFIVSIVLFLLCVIILQRLGFSGIVLQLYPCLAAAYFIVYIMYAAFMFLYYFNDLDGSLITSLIFFVCTLLGSMVSMKLDVIWYGLGLLFGGFCGWTYAFFRLKHMENMIHIHVFCNGNILAQEKGKRPSGMVYSGTTEEKVKPEKKKKSEKKSDDKKPKK